MNRRTLLIILVAILVVEILGIVCLRSGTFWAINVLSLIVFTGLMAIVLPIIKLWSALKQFATGVRTYDGTLFSYHLENPPDPPEYLELYRQLLTEELSDFNSYFAYLIGMIALFLTIIVAAPASITDLVKQITGNSAMDILFLCGATAFILSGIMLAISNTLRTHLHRMNRYLLEHRRGIPRAAGVEHTEGRSIRVERGQENISENIVNWIRTLIRLVNWGKAVLVGTLTGVGYLAKLADSSAVYAITIVALLITVPKWKAE